MKLSLDELALADKIISSTKFYDEQLDIMTKGLQNAHKILDLGVGFGNLAQMLVDKGKFVYGVDNNTASLTYAIRKVNKNEGRFTAIENNVHILNFHEGFDGATCLSNLSEFKNPKKVFQGVYRALVSGGILGITGVKANSLHAYASHLEEDIRTAVKDKRLKLNLIDKGKAVLLYNKLKTTSQGECTRDVINNLQHTHFRIEQRKEFYHDTCYFLLASKP